MIFRRLFGRTSSRAGARTIHKEGNMAVHNAESSRSLADVHDSIKSAVVTIELSDGSGGSGFAVRADGILATNQHVVAGYTTARVSFVDGNDTDAQVVQSFRDVDLAFLLTEEPLRQVLPLHNGEQLRVGQEVFAVGNPLSLGHTLTKGIISALNRLEGGVHYIQTDTAINPGNSGGPLCDLHGQVIGMATRGYDTLEGLNFALPASEIRERLAILPNRSKLRETLYCPACRGIIAEGKYCETCGVELARYAEGSVKPSKKQALLNTCPICKKRAHRGQEHCEHCGASLLPQTRAN